MFGHRDDDDFEDPWFKDKKLEYREFHMDFSVIAYVIAAVVVVSILVACCCSKRRRGGQILSPPPPPPGPNQPALYPQQQYAPYPTQPGPVVTTYPVTSPYPAPAAMFPEPYPPAPAHYPHPAPGVYPPAASAPHAALPPSYDQVMSSAGPPLSDLKQPPYNPAAPHH